MLKVKVLSLTGPLRINVRPLEWDEDYSEMKRKLEINFSCDNQCDEVSNLGAGVTVCVLWRSRWYRAIVIGETDNGWMVRLVDNGQVVFPDLIRECPPEFLQMPARSFSCHLDGVMFGDALIKDDKLLDVVSALPESRVVQVIRKGPPVTKQFEISGIEYKLQSLPVEITFTNQAISDDPFQPQNATVFSLTELFLKSLGVETDKNLDDTFNLVTDDDEAMKEFEEVMPMKDSVKSFHWLPPQLPEKRKFTARGIFVDHSGQIYIQLETGRHTVAALMALLNEKFMDSVLEDPETPFMEGQECCVRWRNGCWFRGRFLRYTDTERVEALVFLVDYGDVHRANVKIDVRKTIYAHRVPIQALRVELAGVTPQGPDNTWTPECLDLIQELISRKVKLEIVDKSNTLPLQVKIKVRLKDGNKHYLDTLLGQEVKNEPHHSPSRKFQELREQSETGIEAVPFGTYKQDNFYSLVYEEGKLDCDHFMLDNRCDEVHYIDWYQTGLSYGDILIGEFVEMGTEPNIVYLHPTDQTNAYFKAILEEYDRLYPLAQVQCEENPPVFKPMVGMLVCVFYKLMGWYRAEIISYSDTTITVRYIDFGNTEVVTDSLKVREIPPMFAQVPAIAVRLELDVGCLDTEDIGQCVMLECLASYEDEDVGIKISGFRDNGSLTGHLVGLHSGAYLYQSLFKEGVFVET